MIWISRDSDAARNPMPHVIVWTDRPVRHVYPEGIFWRDPQVGTDGLVEVIELADCARKYRVTPDDDIQLIRIG